MAEHRVKNYVRPLEEVRKRMLPRARARRNPFEVTEPDEVNRAFDDLTSLDRDHWAETFTRYAKPHEDRAQAADAAGDTGTARESYFCAYNWYRIARYPAPNSPGKRQAYARYKANYLSAARYFNPPLEEVTMPFSGRPGEGKAVVGYLRKPAGVGPLPVVVSWGGIDSFKEDRRAEPFLARNLAVLTIDQPGTGEAPIPGSEDAERMWDGVFDWIASQPVLDAARVGILGASTGGYWAAKLAHTHRERIRAAVNHGGCAHYAFKADWIERAQQGDYPLELSETLAAAFGRSTFEEWVEYAPRLSLLDQGVLGQPCAPLLCVNGLHDTVFPIQDNYLLLEHGMPKSARFFNAGHMGDPPENIKTITEWLATQLSS
jgi:pimeloyl-ACP methyl ester carboxylesterase